jgi:hypothetical protein
LANGWNPHLRAYRLPPELRGYTNIMPWPQHYPKAGWLASAVLVAAGLDVEAAKLAPGLLMTGLFLGVYGIAVRYGLGRFRAGVLAILAAANPIAIVQLFSRMNDGQMALSFALMVLFLALWLEDRRYVFALAAASVAFYGINLKFSALPLFAILSILILCVSAWLRGPGESVRVSALLAVIGIVGTAGLGFHPYVTNTLTRHHPFHPVMGEGAVDIMSTNRPAELVGASPVQRLIVSYLGSTASGYDGSGGLKVPFTITLAELEAAGLADTRLAGFGPLFFGAVLIAVGLGGWIAIGGSSGGQRVALACMAALGLVSLGLPEAWWARYVPQLWWVPAGVAALGLLSRQRPVRIAGWLLSGVLLLDAALVTASAATMMARNSWRVHRQLRAMAAAPVPSMVFLGAAHARLELLHKWRVDVRLSSTPLPASCQPNPLAGTFWTPAGTSAFCAYADERDRVAERSAPAPASSAIAEAARHYSTSFDEIENPLSTNGAWINGGAVGLDWADVKSIGGFATGTYLRTVYADPTAVLAGNWAPDQEVEAKIGVRGMLSPSAAREVEIRLRTTIKAHAITGYEINCSVVPGNPYLGVVRWNGPLNDFTDIGRTALGCSDGDVLKGVARDETITVYKNGTQVLRVTDNRFSTGSPGIGFYDSSANLATKLGFGTWIKFGLQNFSARELAPRD